MQDRAGWLRRAAGNRAAVDYGRADGVTAESRAAGVSAMTQTFEGGCHCGRVRFRVAADLDGVTECNCSICNKKGFLHLIVPSEQFELISGQDDLATYQFNTGT